MMAGGGLIRACWWLACASSPCTPWSKTLAQCIVEYQLGFPLDLGPGLGTESEGHESFELLVLSQPNDTQSLSSPL